MTSIDVVLTSIRPPYVVSTSIRRHSDVMCQLGDHTATVGIYDYFTLGQGIICITQQTHDVEMTSLQRHHSASSQYDVILMSYACWVVLKLHIYLKPRKTYALPSLPSSPKSSPCPPLTHTQNGPLIGDKRIPRSDVIGWSRG